MGFTHLMHRLLDNQAVLDHIDSAHVSAALILLVVLLLWQVVGALRNRQWLLQSFKSSPNLLALNAFILALLNIGAKLEMRYEEDTDDDELGMLAKNVLICAMIGAFMPSVTASMDLSNVWSNVAGVGLLVLSSNLAVFLNMPPAEPGGDYHASAVISRSQVEHSLVMASSVMLFCVYLTQAMALEAMMLDVKDMVSKKLRKFQFVTQQDLSTPAEASSMLIISSWEVVEHNTYMKLMMALTSNLQNVVARSPCVAVVGTLVLFSFGALLYSVVWFHVHPRTRDYTFTSQPESQPVSQPISTNLTLTCLAIIVCVFNSVWRWLRVALLEDRSLKFLLLSSAQQCHWRRKVNNVLCRLQSGSGPRSVQFNVLKKGKHGFREVVASVLILFVLPIHRVLVTFIIYTHILSALLMQKIARLLCLTVLSCIPRGLLEYARGVFRGTESANSSQYLEESLDAVVWLAGEDPQIVRNQVLGTANFIIQQQVRRASMSKWDVRALTSLLQRTSSSSQLIIGPVNSVSIGMVQNVLDQRGAPQNSTNLQVEQYGCQYGWRLTTISLLVVMNKIEVEVLRTSEMSEGAIHAYWQAMEMMRVVDEQYVSCNVCTNDIYTSAVALQWLKLPKKRRRLQFRWPSRSLDQILEALVKNIDHTFVAGAPWPAEKVVSYTMHTICQNLLRWHQDPCNNMINSNTTSGVELINIERGKAMVEYMNAVVAEVMRCCLFHHLALALDMRMTDAVEKGSIASIEEGILLVARSKRVWAELQWPNPLPCSDPAIICTSSTLGQLRQYLI